MGSVSNRHAAAWEPSRSQFSLLNGTLLTRSARILSVPQSWESGMNDLLVVGITIVIFAVLFLIVKGAERIER
jgi:hypothetical protein